MSAVSFYQKVKFCDLPMVQKMNSINLSMFPSIFTVICVQSKELKCLDKSYIAAHEVEATTQCYSCGYMKKGDSIAEAIPGIPFCNGKKSSPKQLFNQNSKQCNVSYFHEIQGSKIP